MAWPGRESPEDIRLPLPWNAATPRARAEPRGPLSMRNIHHKRSELRGGALELASPARHDRERDHSAFRRSPAAQARTTNDKPLAPSRGARAPRAAAARRAVQRAGLRALVALQRAQSPERARHTRRPNFKRVADADDVGPRRLSLGASRRRRPRPHRHHTTAAKVRGSRRPKRARVGPHTNIFFSNLGICTVRPTSPPPPAPPPRPQSAP